jgi:hypothetical protein
MDHIFRAVCPANGCRINMEIPPRLPRLSPLPPPIRQPWQHGNIAPPLGHRFTSLTKTHVDCWPGMPCSLDWLVAAVATWQHCASSLGQRVTSLTKIHVDRWPDMPCSLAWLVAGCNTLGCGSFRGRPVPFSPAQSYKTGYLMQCCGSGSESESTCFWASRIRILLSSCKSSKKNFDSYYFVSLFDFLSLKNDVNVASKSNKQKKL